MRPSRIARSVSLFFLVWIPAPAQESPSFAVRESVMTVGATPVDGMRLASASFRITLATVGESASATSASGPSFRLDGGFVSAFVPPGEVAGLRFDGKATVSWDPERSRGAYNVYADGICSLPSVPDESAALPAGDPPAGVHIEYLVTVENRLGEEGTLGRVTNGAERPNDAPCP